MTLEQTEYSSRFTFFWDYALVAGFLSVVTAFAASSLDALRPQRYSQLIVGSIAWNQGLKQPDYVLLLSLIVSFLLTYVGLYFLSQSVRKFNGVSAECAFRQLLIYCLLPCGVLLGKLLVKSSDVILDVATELCAGSLFLLLATIGFAIFLVCRKLRFVDSDRSINTPDTPNLAYLEVVGSSLLIIFFSFLIGSALSLAIGRIYLPWQLETTKQVTSITVIGALILWLPLIGVWLKLPSHLDFLHSRLRFLLWSAQAFLPLFFLTLLPTPWTLGDNKFYGYSFSYALPALIIAAIAIAYIDWFRRLKLFLQKEQESIFSVVSPVCLIALLLYAKAPLISAGVIPTDDYHWGEFLLPWWLLKSFHYIPFWDYEPARGLVNYAIGLVANLFFSDTTAAYQVASAPGNAVLMLPYLSIIFLTLARAIGLMPAFLACLLMPMADGISEIDCMTTAALCVLGSAFFNWQPSKWLLIWGIIGIALLLFAPGQGGLLILSTLPIAGFALFRAIRKDRRKLLLTAGIGVFVFFLLCLITPLGKMLAGAVRYGAEQSSINSVAHGIPWSASVDSNPVLSYWLWEILRTSWVLIGITSGLLILRAFVDKTWSQRYRYMVFGIPILLLSILFIPRAAGRIDPSGFSRLGIASTWAVCLLLPIILVTAYGQRRKALSLMIVALWGGAMVGVPIPNSILAKPVQAVEVQSIEYIDGDRLGLDHLEHTFIDRAKFNRLRKIKRVLRTVLRPDETYLDLTNHNADYFYLGYPPPIQAGAFYNLPHPNQQLRAIQKLEASPPPIALVSANDVFDGGPSSLRAHFLYRYLVEHYIPVEISGFIYMVRPDRLQQLRTRLPEATGILSTDTEARLKLLDQAFRAVDLKKIPSAWGASFQSLTSELQPVKAVDTSAIAELHSVERTSSNTYRVTGADPFVSFDVERLNLNGRDAGILTFDLSSTLDSSANLEIYWGSRSLGSVSESTVVRFSAQTGKVVVPLDAAPRWLLAKDIQIIRLDIAEPAPSTFSISNVTFFQRAELGRVIR